MAEIGAVRSHVYTSQPSPPILPTFGWGLHLALGSDLRRVKLSLAIWDDLSTFPLLAFNIAIAQPLFCEARQAK